jgi:TPR repeat protein
MKKEMSMSLAGWIRRIAHAGRGAALAALLALLAGAAAAAPDDDFKEALRLYQLGDMVGAMGKLRPAADAGHGPSMALLAHVLDQSGFVDEALALYQRAVGKDDPDGQYGLANMLLSGRGIERDEARAYQLIETAARTGHVLSINAVAQAFMSGTLGRKQVNAANPEGLSWIERSAANGFLPAIDFLAKGWRSGTLGPADPKKAETYEKQADLVRYQGKPPPRTRK